MKWSVTWALALVVVGSTLLQAAPRSKTPKGAQNAKTVDVFKALTDKQVDAQVTAQSPASATLTLTNLTQEPLNVKVPLAVAAVPQAPQGANEQYYLGAFGTPAPQSLAVAVSPLGASGVQKKARKTGVKPNKKKADEAKDEKEGDDKDAKDSDEKKDSDSLEAYMVLAPGGSQTLALLTLSLDSKKLQASYGPFSLSELDKVSDSAEMKSLLEKVSQGVVPRNVAQTLAWHYHGRRSWDEMTQDGLINTPVELQAAQQFADVVEGRAPAKTAAAATGKKKRKVIGEE